jgi:hypothetical protein
VDLRVDGVRESLFENVAATERVDRSDTMVVPERTTTSPQPPV